MKKLLLITICFIQVEARKLTIQNTSNKRLAIGQHRVKPNGSKTIDISEDAITLNAYDMYKGYAPNYTVDVNIQKGNKDLTFVWGSGSFEPQANGAITLELKD